MKIERDFHMIKGDGDTSYAKNSRLQRKAIILTKQIVEKAISGVCTDLQPRSMAIADLGCSSGPNTLLFISNAITTICENRSDSTEKECAAPCMEVQFFLNDLPSNDFNHIFQSLEQFEQSIERDCACRGLQAPPRYVAGVPGSFYTRLFPRRSIHFFHSSFSLMWLSQVPENLDGGINEGNIHILASTPPSVTKLYRDQFEKDFSQFLRMRSSELVPAGGRMVLTLLGRKSNESMDAGGMTTVYDLLSLGLRALVAEGRVEKEKLDSFNVPMYCPSADELKQLVQENTLLEISDIHLIETIWNPMVDDNDGAAATAEPAEVAAVAAARAAGQSISSTIRAVTGPLIARHFGESILDELFAGLARDLIRRIESDARTSAVTIISMSLKAQQY